MNLLKEAKSKFKKGDLFLSATGNVRSPLTVNELKLSENYPNTVVNESGGVICMEDETKEDGKKEIIWAIKIEN